MPEPAPRTVDELNQLMSRPSERVLEVIRTCAEDGDFTVLGAGGKMGFHLCLMLRRGLEKLGPEDKRKVIAVSRFGSVESKKQFEDAGFEMVSADLSKPEGVAGLSLVPNVFFLAGVKFGTGSDTDLLHRMNVVMPGLVAERFSSSRIVALSTGCVYSFTTPESGGSNEDSETDPPGAYAKSCQGREEQFTKAAVEYGTRSALVRLNYSIDLRYGVLVDIAQKVLAGEAVNVDMGYVNLIWQRDAIDQIIQCLLRVSAPPFVVNVTGAEVLSVRKLAEAFGERFGREVVITGEEAPCAWLSNPSLSHQLFGKPETSLEQMIHWVADWLEADREILGKPTHFQNRKGTY